MLYFIVRRLLQTCVVIILVTVVVFAVMHSMPGNPVVMLLGPDASIEQIEYFTRMFGLDQPLVVQYGKWIGNLAHGEFGKSIAYRSNIGPMMQKRFLVTLTIALPAFSLAVLLGVSMGVVAAMRRGKLADSIITVTANIGMATPVFWLSIVCVYFFSLKLKWLPVQGFTWPSENFPLALKKMIMPVCILALGPMASFARQTRSSMLEVIRQDYIRTARSKGLKENNVIFRHALRNAMIPIVTLMGMQLGYMIGGSVLIEQVYVIPGMGNMLITAILNKDYLLVQSTVFVIATGVSLCNLAVDIAYGYIDPRIRIS
ncbi:MAG: ABC transporter permease [Rectinemataceae bacterium]|nr:ABC transporter permease [Rectinemataceae bacterium]